MDHQITLSHRNSDTRHIYRSRPAAITPARCRHNRQTFGVHFTRVEGTWVNDYAFRISPRFGQAEGHSLNRTLRGRFGKSRDYPGCPFCKDKVLFKCGCGGLTCFVTDEADFQPFACAWCDDWIASYSNGWDSVQTSCDDL